MKKIGFIVDSFACIDQKEADALGVGFLPFQLDIDGTVIDDDGITLSREEVLTKIGEVKNVKTSLPKLNKTHELFTQICSQYEEVIYMPINSHLSGASNAANNFLAEFPNLKIYHNHLVGPQYFEVINFIQEELTKGKEVDEILEVVDKIQAETVTFILPQKLEYAIKGGRVGGLKRLVLKTIMKMKLFPYIKFSETGNSTPGIARSIKSAIKQIVEKILKFSSVKTLEELHERYNIFCIYGNDYAFNKEIEQYAQEFGLIPNIHKLSSAVIAIHTGPEAISFSISPKTKYFAS
ncbi:DegV family protein [Mycoplasmopsis columbinasalis]|uniref:DegV-like protein n=1 Tax=Mycoplasmopsis columbinasalis TaxID=114880 RepID=A0A449B9I8_9BACT|nr:DegV family protein [Mycoplasmopsis columbinasalis]VEU77849.1 degV-like protein [Mycoplasmopsis columbinasalis]